MTILISTEYFMHLFSIAKDMDKDKNYDLNKVFFYKKGHSFYMIALDGHAMPIYHRTEDEEGDFLYEVKYNKEFEAVVKSMGCTMLYMDTDSMTITPHADTQFNIKMVESDFTVIESIFDKVKKTIQSPTFAPTQATCQYTQKMYARIVRNKKERFCFFGDTERLDDCMIGVSENPEYMAVVMPQKWRDFSDEIKNAKEFFGIEEA